uniref:Uncharacterized protein n=1 Tax=Oryza brachyantha TaxID=4533 RepID=J3NAQ9_ORYBR
MPPHARAAFASACAGATASSPVPSAPIRRRFQSSQWSMRCPCPRRASRPPFRPAPDSSPPAVPATRRDVLPPLSYAAAASSLALVGRVLLAVPPLPLLFLLLPVPPLFLLALKCVALTQLRFATMGPDLVEGRPCWADLVATTSLLVDPDA